MVKTGLSLWGHHLQAGSEDAESRGCETGLQITDWRAGDVTFVCWCVSRFKPQAGMSCAFSVVASHRIPVIAASDQTRQHQQRTYQLGLP